MECCRSSCESESDLDQQVTQVCGLPEVESRPLFQSPEPPAIKAIVRLQNVLFVKPKICHCLL